MTCLSFPLRRLGPRGLTWLCAVMALFMSTSARAEPYLAVVSGLRCAGCHVNPTGGGLRNAVGVAYANGALAAWQLPADTPTWTGAIGDRLRLGADLRHQWTRLQVQGQPTQQRWAVEQLRVYADVSLIANRLALHVDQQLSPGSSLNQEAYARLQASDGGWYLKGGQFYLPFGWRLEDDSAFVRQITGVNMTAPDRGIEAGIEGARGSAQVALSNGSANAGSSSGHQLLAQAVWVHAEGRLGAAAGYTRAASGNRQMLGFFGGLRTGPLAWLGEVDLVRDAGYAQGRRSLLAALGELNWAVLRGHNLKITGEYLDPDRKVSEDHRTRLSLVWEFTPLPFVQLRTGIRRWDGIPQNAVDNRRLLFFELHAFL
jgi:hypothetical protein